MEMGFDPEYFLDKMSTWEINTVLEQLPYRNRPQWEMSRMIACVVAQVHSTQSINPSDVRRFPWDPEPDVDMSDIEIERLKKKMEDRINGSGSSNEIASGDGAI